MKLGTTNLPGAYISDIKHALKIVEHEYDYGDITDYTVLGSGPTRLTITGLCNSETDRIAIEYVCRQAIEKKLYFPSTPSATDDRYYRVYTEAASWSLETPKHWRYTFVAMTVVPWVYSASTNQPISGQGA